MMKKLLFVVALLCAGWSTQAQEPKNKPQNSTTLPMPEFKLPDSLAHYAPWRPSFKTMSPVKTTPKISMTSVVAIQKENLPSRVTVLNNNVLRLGGHSTLSNGQAWNNGPFHNAYLDARTLSFPGRR